ncbi:MAG TPA: hypothetical protein VGZ73_12540 [Bryobacteraceae bacterium]|jgi:hypothetical protein|nr:hypothetical protein [Bryobacteraceae bacterium]
MSRILKRNWVARNIPIQDGLVSAIPALNDKVVHLAGQFAVPDERQDEVVELLVAVPGIHADYVVLVEGRENGLRRVLRLRIVRLSKRDDRDEESGDDRKTEHRRDSMGSKMDTHGVRLLF